MLLPHHKLHEDTYRLPTEAHLMRASSVALQPKATASPTGMRGLALDSALLLAAPRTSGNHELQCLLAVIHPASISAKKKLPSTVETRTSISEG